ncbi:hypothetical protein RESH_04877 [Rhodopirellula europaea SH398]|uniref:Uncharacterized protein n=1 Tax=Rhodopirellula europaea SH398 TaxID=1263868 RepID=M5RZ71_9BACT|nr:hypothetical protein RESH_04877 [Rhodopirellula europaea SH398]
MFAVAPAYKRRQRLKGSLVITARFRFPARQWTNSLAERSN